MSSGRRIFVGDVHGHYDGLIKLLETIGPSSDDQIYFVGDLIDRGPKSAQVVQLVRDNNYSCVLGNHEQLLLGAFPDNKVSHLALQAWVDSGGDHTVASYSKLDELLETLNWLRGLPIYLDLGDIWLAHAGLDPKLPVHEQTTHEYCWIRSEFHSMDRPYFPNKLIITGHTITFTLPGVAPGCLAQGQGWLDIDTGAYHHKSGWLTAVDMTQHLAYQVNVLHRRIRTLPLAEATIQVEPKQVMLRRRQLLPSYRTG